MPWRRIGIGAVVALVVLGAAAAAVIPAIDRGKERGAARDRAERAAFVRRELARLRRDQAPHFGRTAATSPHAIIAALGAAITRDVRARVHAGTLTGHVLRTDCDRGNEGKLDPRTGRAIYRCLAVQGEPIDPRNQVKIVKGYPFIASVDLERGRFCWCKLNVLPGEHDTSSIPHVLPSRKCAGPLRPIL